SSKNAKKSFVDHILNDAKKFRRFGVNMKEVGSPSLVDDVAKQTLAEIVNGRREPGIYHIANSGGCTMFEWASEIIKILGLPTELWKKDPAAFNRAALRPESNMLVTEKLPPMRSWQEALAEFLRSEPGLRDEVFKANPIEEEKELSPRA
ncbi:MAG: sugar nucleotide-binding protein, partial [bacterium]